MSVPHANAVGNSPVITAPARPSGLYNSPLHLDADHHGSGESRNAGSPWRATNDPGSPLDDNRSIASSARSARRRRGAAAPESATATGDGKEWSQAFMDLERMQRENKERMQGSVRSGRSSPGEDPFFRSGSTSSCRSSVRRRRWAAASGTYNNNNNNSSGATNGPAGLDGTATSMMSGGGEEGLHGSVSIKSPVPNTSLMGSHGGSVTVPRLIATADTESATTTNAAGMGPAAARAAEPTSAARAGSPFGNTSFSPKEGEDAEGSAGAKPRLSGLPMWLKRRPTANTPKKLPQVPSTGSDVATSADEDKQVTSSEATEEQQVTEDVAAAVSVPSASAESKIAARGPPQDAPSRSLKATEPESQEVARTVPTANISAEETREAQTAEPAAALPKTQAASHSSPTSPIRKARLAGGSTGPASTTATTANAQSITQPRRSPAPGPARETHPAPVTTPSFTSGASHVATRRHSSASASSSPLMQTYLARHTRAAAVALAAAGGASHERGAEESSTPSKAEPAAAAEVASTPNAARENVVEKMEGAASSEKAKPSSVARDGTRSPAVRSPPPPPDVVVDATGLGEKDVPSDVRSDHVQLPATLTVDKGEGHEHPAGSAGVVADLTGGQSTLQTSPTALAAVQHTDAVAAGRKNSTDTTTTHTSTSPDVKVKRPARVVKQDLSAKKPAAEHAAHSTAAPSTKSRAAAAVKTTPASASPPHSVSRERPSASVSRARPSTSIAREPREASHAPSEASVPRSSRQRKSVSVAHGEGGVGETSLARTSRERSTTAAAAAAGERVHETPSGHLQRSTALFEMRRQQVLLDRQERERKSAAEEKARLGMLTQTSAVKKKIPTAASSSAAANATSTTDTKEAGVGSVAATPVKKETSKAVSHPGVDGQSSRVVRRLASTTPASTTTTAATASAADGRPHLATAPSAAAPQEPRRNAANASTTTRLASPTMTAMSAPAPAVHALALNTPSAPDASASTSPPPVTANTPATASAAPGPRGPTTVTTLSHARKPIINTASLAHPAASTTTAPAATAASSASPAATASTNAMRSRAAEANAPAASRTNKVSLSPAVTRAPLHRTGVSTRREVPSPSVSTTAAAPTMATASTASGVRRTERRVSAKLATLTTLKSPTAAAETASTTASEKGSKARNRSEDSGLKSPPPPDAAPASTASVEASPVVRESAAQAPVPVPEAVSATPPPPSTPPPAAAELRPAPFCVECGQRHVDDTAKFCAVCGHKRVFV